MVFGIQFKKIKKEKRQPNNRILIDHETKTNIFNKNLLPSSLFIIISDGFFFFASKVVQALQIMNLQKKNT